jgi:hypothetical protein
MARSKLEAHRATPSPKQGIEILRDEILADGLDQYADQFEDALDDESDFDVEDDIAFMGEEYDVLELDDVLELCNLDKRGPYQN